jgi:hypothetical protein
MFAWKYAATVRMMWSNIKILHYSAAWRIVAAIIIKICEHEGLWNSLINVWIPMEWRTRLLDWYSRGAQAEYQLRRRPSETFPGSTQSFQANSGIAHRLPQNGCHLNPAKFCHPTIRYRQRRTIVHKKGKQKWSYYHMLYRLRLRSRKPRLTAVGIRCADLSAPSIGKSWH